MQVNVGDVLQRVVFSRTSDDYFIKTDVVVKIDCDKIHLSKGKILTIEQDAFKEAKYKYWQLKTK